MLEADNNSNPNAALLVTRYEGLVTKLQEQLRKQEEEIAFLHQHLRTNRHLRQHEQYTQQQQQHRDVGPLQPTSSAAPPKMISPSRDRSQQRQRENETHATNAQATARTTTTQQQLQQQPHWHAEVEAYVLGLFDRHVALMDEKIARLVAKRLRRVTHHHVEGSIDHELKRQIADAYMNERSRLHDTLGEWRRSLYVSDAAAAGAKQQQRPQPFSSSDDKQQKKKERRTARKQGSTAPAASGAQFCLSEEIKNQVQQQQQQKGRTTRGQAAHDDVSSSTTSSSSSPSRKRHEEDENIARGLLSAQRLRRHTNNAKRQAKHARKVKENAPILPKDDAKENVFPSKSHHQNKNKKNNDRAKPLEKKDGDGTDEEEAAALRREREREDANVVRGLNSLRWQIDQLGPQAAADDFFGRVTAAASAAGMERNRAGARISFNDVTNTNKNTTAGAGPTRYCDAGPPPPSSVGMLHTSPSRHGQQQQQQHQQKHQEEEEWTLPPRHRHVPPPIPLPQAVQENFSNRRSVNNSHAALHQQNQNPQQQQQQQQRQQVRCSKWTREKQELMQDSFATTSAAAGRRLTSPAPLTHTSIPMPVRTKTVIGNGSSLKPSGYY